MTIATYNSIWEDAFDSTRFGKIGIRMAEILNFRIFKDATQQVTTAGSTPILEHISEEALIELVAASKETGVTNPWDFIQANIGGFMMRKMRQWKEFLDDIESIEGQKESIEFSDIGGFGASGDK